MKKILVVTQIFSSAHLYHQKKWSTERNQTEFGKCFTEFGHGHNYRFEVGFEEPSVALMELQKVVKSVTDVLDHQHLNFVVPDFKENIPTTENIAHYLHEKMRTALPRVSISFLKLYEMDNLWVEVLKPRVEAPHPPT